MRESRQYLNFHFCVNLSFTATTEKVHFFFGKYAERRSDPEENVGI